MSNATTLAFFDTATVGQQVRVTDCWGDSYVGQFGGLDERYVVINAFGARYRVERKNVSAAESAPEVVALSADNATTELVGKIIVDRVTDARFRVKAVENEETGTILDIALAEPNDHYDAGDTREIWVDDQTMPRWAIETA